MRAAHMSMLVAAGLLTSGALAAEGEGPYVLAADSWVCTTPEAYDAAVAAAETTDDIRALRQRLLDKKRCMTIDGEDMEDMMAPFVQVFDRQDDKIKVIFEIECYKRIAFLHRAFLRVKFAGWTNENQLRPRASLADDD